MNLQHLAIISQLHAGRQPRTRRPVREVVRDVREVRTLGPKTCHDVERLIDAEVGAVRTIAERVESIENNARPPASADTATRPVRMRAAGAFLRSRPKVYSAVS